MGCSSSLPDRSSGRLVGTNSENGGAPDAKNIRVKIASGSFVDSFIWFCWVILESVKAALFFVLFVVNLILHPRLLLELHSCHRQLLCKTLQQYAALAPLYYRGAAVAVVVYDITSPDSFAKAQYWVKELQKHGSPDIIMALVGNKADLHEKREVSVQDGIECAEKNGMFFIETSAKTADNINQLFEEIAKRLPRPTTS